MDNKIKYTGQKNMKDTYSFSLFGKRWQDGQDLTPDEVKLFANVQLGDWEITNINNTTKEEVKTEPKKEEKKEEIEEVQIK